MKSPSDLKILNAIYNEYYSEYSAFDKQNPSRQAKILIPVDCKKIGKKLNVDSDIIFGRLYYHMEKEYGYKDEKGIRIVFFANSAGDEIHCINFPYMASVLGKLQHEDSKFKISTWLSIVALIVSVIALCLSA